MANIPLVVTEWEYNEDNNRVVAKFADTPAANHPDPAAYEPTMFFTIEFAPTVIEQDVPTNGS
jgi:hypothetical protein